MANTYTISKIILPNGDICNIKSTINLFGICSTNAATAAKTVSITGFNLTNGVTIQVKFTYENEANNPTLNVSSTGAIAITLPNDNLSPWDAGEVVSLTYDGTSWNINDYGKVEVVIF